MSVEEFVSQSWLDLASGPPLSPTTEGTDGAGPLDNQFRPKAGRPARRPAGSGKRWACSFSSPVHHVLQPIVLSLTTLEHNESSNGPKWLRIFGAKWNKAIFANFTCFTMEMIVTNQL